METAIFILVVGIFIQQCVIADYLADIWKKLK